MPSKIKKASSINKVPGATLERVSLQGKFLAWGDAEGVFLEIPGSPYVYCICFETVEQLKAVLQQLNIHFTKVLTIGDEVKFIQQLPRKYAGYELKIITNLDLKKDGTCTFTQVMFN